MASVSAIIIITDQDNCTGENAPVCEAIDQAIIELGNKNNFTPDYRIIGMKPSKAWEGFDYQGQKLPLVLFYIDKDGGDYFAGKLLNRYISKANIKETLLNIYEKDNSFFDSLEGGNGWIGTGKGRFGLGGFDWFSSKWFWIILLVLLLGFIFWIYS